MEGDEPAAADGASASLRGDETVLVVEDEDGVRELLWKILTDHGHTVLEARHGRDALTVAAGYDHPIQLLVTDVVMPEMGAGRAGGPAAHRASRAQGAVYLGIHQRRGGAPRGVSRSETAFIQKPFTLGGADAEECGGCWTAQYNVSVSSVMSRLPR